VAIVAIVLENVSCNIMKKDALSLYPLYLFSFGKDKKV
jgi:hypothetical protein